MTELLFEHPRLTARAVLTENAGLWLMKVSLRTPTSKTERKPALSAKHMAVAINLALQELEKMGASLPETEHQLLMMWIRQTNRNAWAGISDEKRAAMYQDERKTAPGRK